MTSSKHRSHERDENTGTDEPDVEQASGGRSSGESEPSALSYNQTFSILSNQRRRDTLRYLDEHGGEATLDEVAECIAAKENDISVDELSSDQRKRVYIGLYQNHMSQLDRAGVVDYNKGRGWIRLNETANQLFRHLEVADADDDGLAETDEGETSPDPGDAADSRDLGVFRLTPVVTGAAAAAVAVGILSEAGVIALDLLWSLLGGLVLTGISAVHVLEIERDELTRLLSAED